MDAIQQLIVNKLVALGMTEDEATAASLAKISDASDIYDEAIEANATERTVLMLARAREAVYNWTQI